MHCGSGPVSESGTLCRGDTGQGRGDRRRRVLKLATLTLRRMQITSEVELDQTGRRRLRWRIVARALRLAVAIGLAAVVFISPGLFVLYGFELFIPVHMAIFFSPSILERIVWVLVFLVGLAAIYILIVLISSRKIPVLFLRRFGLSGPNRTITRAIEGGLGRHYRVLTLDDSNFVPLEVPRIERIFSRLGIPFAVLVFFLALVSFSGGLGLPDAVALRILYWFPMGLYAALLWLPLLGLSAIVLVILIYRWIIRRSFKLEIGSVEQLRRCIARVRGLAAWLRRPSMMAPQAVVVRVVSKLWQEAVSDLAGQVRLVICDVSEPTDNLIWEVERMSARPEVKCVFIGNGPMVQKWAQATGEPDADTPASRMKSLLQEQTILVFDPARRFPQRRFTRNLRNSLENVRA